MKKYWFRFAGIAALVACLPFVLGPVKKGPTRQEFMRDKLEHAQEALKGLALADYKLIGDKARKLAAMSEQATWRVFENPDYEKFSSIFRKSATDLAQAAKTRNIDGATLAYMRVTMNCVECHKFVRGRLVADLDSGFLNLGTLADVGAGN